jgi:hypothetical protein
MHRPGSAAAVRSSRLVLLEARSIIDRRRISRLPEPGFVERLDALNIAPSLGTLICQSSRTAVRLQSKSGGPARKCSRGERHARPQRSAEVSLSVCSNLLASWRLRVRPELPEPDSGGPSSCLSSTAGYPNCFLARVIINSRLAARCLFGLLSAGKLSTCGSAPGIARLPGRRNEKHEGGLTVK